MPIEADDEAHDDYIRMLTLSRGTASFLTANGNEVEPGNSRACRHRTAGCKSCLRTFRYWLHSSKRKLGFSHFQPRDFSHVNLERSSFSNSSPERTVKRFS